MHTHQCTTRTQKPLQRGRERREICERRVSPFRAEIAANMDFDVSNATGETQATEAFYIGKKPTFRANIRPHTAPHFKALQQMATPTNINTSRNSRPSFLIDDVRFWMLFFKYGARTFHYTSNMAQRSWEQCPQDENWMSTEIMLFCRVSTTF